MANNPAERDFTLYFLSIRYYPAVASLIFRTQSGSICCLGKLGYESNLSSRGTILSLKSFAVGLLVFRPVESQQSCLRAALEK
jgi:hypothetical protein